MATGHAFRPKGSRLWRARWDLGIDAKTGRRRQRSKGGFVSKQAAEAYAATQTARVAAGEKIDGAATTLGAFLDRWLAGVRGEIRASTFGFYAGNIRNHIRPVLGRRRLADLDREELRAYYASLDPNIADRVHRTLRRALNEAVASGLLMRNPVVGMRRNRSIKARGRGMRVLSAEELARFLHATTLERGAVWAPYFRLLAMTGCRRGEALGIFWSDVDLDGSTVIFQRAIVEPGAQLEETKTRSSRRRVDLDADTVAALRSWRDHQEAMRTTAGCAWKQTVELSSGQHLANDLVFTRPSGQWILPGNPSHAFWRICARAAVPRVRLHDLRHTHATLLLKAGINPKVVSERLGHQSIAITLDLYGHVLPAMGKEAATVFATLVGDNGDAVLAAADTGACRSEPTPIRVE